MSKVRNFCFTSYKGKLTYDDKMKYLLQGEEVCPTTGRVHIQGFVIFKNQRTLSGVIKEYPGINFEICKGSIESNMTYCKKDGKFSEEGEIPKGSGHRTDLDNVSELIKKGGKVIDIIENHGTNYIRYHKGIEKMINIVNLKPRNWEMDVRIYWGAPGTGKTKSVFDEFGQDNIYVKTVGKWWDGYQGEPCVLIDDFDPKNCFDITFDFYLKLLDRYKLLIEMKGSMGNFCSKTIIFTSNFDPAHWFLDKSNRSAFFRRVCSVKCFDGSRLRGDGVIIGPSPESDMLEILKKCGNNVSNVL